MTKKPNRNTEGLKEHAQNKNEETIIKVNNAIDKLKRSKTKEINFVTVAKEAGVSKATLYNNDALKERIMSLRAIVKGSPDGNWVAAKRDKMQAKDEKIKQLYERVKQLEEDKKNLVIQLIGEHKLKKEIEKLKAQSQKLSDKLDKKVVERG